MKRSRAVQQTASQAASNQKQLLKRETNRARKGTGSRRVGYERFALVHVTLEDDKATCIDFFDPAVKIRVDATAIKLDSTNTTRKAPALLLMGNNGTQINLDKQSHTGKWEHLAGFGAGPKLLGFPTPHYDLWASFIDHCHFIDIKDDEVWGLGKWKNRDRLKEADIATRLHQMYESA